MRIGSAMKGLVVVRLVIVLVSVIGAVVAIDLGRREFAAIRQVNASEAAFVSALVQDESAGFVPARSNAMQQAQMTSCITWKQHGLTPIFPPFMQQALAEACLSRADEILAQSPSRSAAHMVAAAAHAMLGAPESAVQSLALAQDTGRHEGWMAARRLDLGLALGFDSSVQAETRADALQLAAQELPVLTSHHVMADQIASLYRLRPATRDWMVTEIEQLDPAAQALFLQRVRVAMQAQP